MAPADGSTLHPELRTAEMRAGLAAQWRAGGAMRLQGVLEPGLAAELACTLWRMPVEPRIYAAHTDLSWSCDVGVPRDPDPQHPPCLFRLTRFLRLDLPALVSAIVGRALTVSEPDNIHLWALRKGAYVDDGGPLAPAGGLDVLLGLTGAHWPADWGGHMVWTSARDRSMALPPGFDTLDLLDGGRFQIPLLTRPVESLSIRATLEPVEGSA